MSATNVEATKEPGEPLHGTFGAKGHSVWFEWEATSTGFVTVGTCGSDFTTVTGVYTGTAVTELTQVAGNFESEGPGCPSFNGREVTFKATSGTIYEIAVDGDPFYLPPAKPPIGEGAIELQIEATPNPDNDDFVDAKALTGAIEEEEGAEFAFYWANASGFNWNATKEPGEPEHAGDPGGASVWYSWTAPASGTAKAGACVNFAILLGVYMGNSVDTLTSIGSDKSHCPQVTFSAVAGTTYRIAVDGEFDSGTGDVRRGSLYAHVSMQLPPRAKEAQAPQSPGPSPSRDVTPPSTSIYKRKMRPGKRTATLVFGSDESGSAFRCKLDRKAFAPCGSPKTYRNLRPGRHAFEVAAVDAAGNADPSPAVARFVITKPKPHRKR